ncbi:MAG TPA: LuxR C-terminal-related transcriptional regulator [Acidimicrobiales bacterium]
MLGGRAGMSPVMVGRSAALAQLQAVLPAAGDTVADLPTVALVAGEAGVGKTRLLRELVALVGPGVTVMAGGADPDSLARPYSLVTAVLGEAVAGDLELDAVLARLATRVGDGPAVIVFEDLHWADAESATVIDRLAQLPCPRLLIVGTYRPDDLSRRLPGGDLLLRLERRHAVEQVRLDRLDRTDVGAMVAAIQADPPNSAVIEALYNRTGGNPFYIEEILAAACREAGPSDLQAVRLPWSLEEAVRSQLEGLTPPERRVLEAAAICGPTSRFEVLARAADMDENDLLAVLRAMVASGLLVEAADDRFSFRHALVSDEVERQLLGRERRLLHERALAALRANGSDDLAAMARHAAGAGRFEEFVALAREGARQYLAQGSTFQALRLAGDALSESPDDPALLAVATESAWLVSLYDEALAYADRWWQVARETADLEEEAAVLRWRLRLHHDMGRGETVADERSRLQELIDELPPGEVRAGAMAAMAQSYMLQDSCDAAVEWADRAIVEATAVGAERVTVQAGIERGSALTHGQRSGAQDLRAAIDAAEALGEWVLVTRGLNNLFETIPVFTPEGRAMVARFRRAAGRAGFDSMSHAISAFREGEIAFGDGDLAAARRAKERGEEWWLRCRQEAEWLTLLELDLAFEEGRAGDARVALDRLALAKSEHASWYARTELEVAWLQTEPIAVLRWFDRYVAAPLPENVYVLTDIFNVVDLALDAGAEPGRVRAGLAAALTGHPVADRARAVAEGLLLARERRPGDAAVQLAAVLAEPDPTLQRFVVGHIRVHLALALLADGDRDGALREVRRALDEELARWPGWRRDRASALFGRLHGPAAAPDGELTGREREVAALLSEGLTNGELARRLFISPKTAAVHVSNILTKLHMSSRAEVAAWAVRSGLADDVLGRAG